MAWNKMDIGEIDTLWLMCSTRSQRCDGLSGCLTSCYLIRVGGGNIKGLLEKFLLPPLSDGSSGSSVGSRSWWMSSNNFFPLFSLVGSAPSYYQMIRKNDAGIRTKKKDHKISGTIFFSDWFFPTVSQFRERERRFTSCFHLGYCSLLVMFSFFDDRFV